MSAKSMASEPGLEIVVRLTVTITEPIDVGSVPGGVRRVIPIAGGRARGPLISGEVLPIGADWNLSVEPGRETVSARYLVRTDDGVVLTVTNEGSITTVGSVVTGLTRPRIEAPEGDYAWLNDAELVGTLVPVEVDGRVTAVDLEFFSARVGSVVC